MKKNISINISGIIFHIEEDGYSTLKDYLDSINKYFSTYEDSGEIIADIESRIAEIFLSKLDDGKQIITPDDVNALIETMGTVADFEAIEEDDLTASAEAAKAEQSSKSEEKTQAEDFGKQKLFRDEKRKVIGGVAAGIAYYFSIDPLWIRLITVLLFFNIFIGAFSGIIFVAYIVLWIIVPGSMELGDDEDVKKMYRDPDNSVMGGVASGIAAYFGVDVTIVRLLFVLSMFIGGTGIILYLILWLITPEAKSITQKMQMQGEPLTLSNIEQSVKSSLKDKDGEESALAKVLLFPFRIIAAVFVALGNLLGPFSKFLIEALRILAGLFTTGLGLTMMIALFISFGVLLGIFTGMGDWVRFYDLPAEVVGVSFPMISYVAGFAAAFIPMFGITLLGISILAKRFVITAPLGWSMFGLWVISLIIMAFSIPNVVGAFKAEAEYKETKMFDFGGQEVTLQLNEVGEELYERTNLRIRGHDDSVYKLDLNYESRGRTREDAKQNAQMLDYSVEQRGNELIFDSNFTFGDRAVFRGQELNMTLYVPYGSVFYMDEDLREILSNTLYRSGYRTWQMEGNQWTVERSGLVCLTCDSGANTRSRSRSRSRAQSDDARPDPIPAPDSRVERRSGASMIFDMENFDEVDVNGIYNVFIEQGDDYEVQVRGNERYKEYVAIRKIGDVLEVDFTKKNWELLKDFQDKYRLDVLITMPNVEKISAKGMCQVEIDNLDTREFDLRLEGASTAEVEIDASDIRVKLTGASSAEFRGDVNYLDATVSGASTLKAYRLDSKTADIKTSGASSARVNVANRLSGSTSGMSSIRYKGSPDLDIDEQSDMSSVRRSRN